jgi:hypothetical protein
VRQAILAVGVAALTLGCAGDGARKPQADPFAETRDSSCYTVDLFTRARIIEPASDVPAQWRGYLGRWGGGKWGGAWCHDLYVTEISADGRVRLIETYGPYDPWGRRAAAFTRTARIDSDGRLRLSYGRTRMEYWLQDGELRGVRDESRGRLLIAMERRSV